jgi:hypothetical protein
LSRCYFPLFLLLQLPVSVCISPRVTCIRRHHRRLGFKSLGPHVKNTHRVGCRFPRHNVTLSDLVLPSSSTANCRTSVCDTTVPAQRDGRLFASADEPQLKPTASHWPPELRAGRLDGLASSPPLIHSSPIEPNNECCPTIPCIPALPSQSLHFISHSSHIHVLLFCP